MCQKNKDTAIHEIIINLSTIYSINIRYNDTLLQHGYKELIYDTIVPVLYPSALSDFISMFL